jgi:hypothetical protein
MSLTLRDKEILAYEALAILEATYLGPGFLSAKDHQDELMRADPSLFDEPDYAVEVQTAVRHLRGMG